MKIKVYDKKCYGVLTKGNGDCFLLPETHSTLCVDGGQAGQGYPCVLVKKEKKNETKI